MAKQLEDLRILLLQIREDEETIQEELDEFVRFSGLHEEQFTLLNSFLISDFNPQIVDRYDALFVGGSSDASVLHPETYTFVKDCKELLRYCYDKDIPTLASCFGFQISIEEFGGNIILDKDNMEMGVYEIKLSEAAKDDILLHDTPESFWAISGHMERATRIPESAISLASSELCPHHAIKFHGKAFYGFQFHPEVDRGDLITRITRYQERYLDDADDLQNIIDASVHETPHANEIVKKFVDRILLEG